MEIECAHCGNRELQQVPGTWTLFPIAEGGTLGQGPAVPVVVLGCPQCGFIEMFTPQVVQPQPFPEGQPGKG